MAPILLFLAYLTCLIVLAWQAKKRSAQTPRDFYLAGGELGIVVLFFTFFATQYSGNTFMGFSGKAYRMGYAYLMSVTFMIAIVTAYCLYAPRLRKIAVREKFVTPGDWIHFRYQNLPLTLVTGGLMAYGLVNFLLAQLMAMGHAFSGLTQGAVPYEAGVLALALLIVIYETVGGMRAVAWTDVIQGALMFGSVLVIAAYFLLQPAIFHDLPDQIALLRPQAVSRPDGDTCRLWLSSILLVGLGGAMYPQAIQRIYAAFSMKSLKKALSLMAFVPLVTVFFAVMMGLISITRFPGLEGTQSDQVMMRLMSSLARENWWLYLAATFLAVGALAAIMSTADSVLLSLSSILVLDGVAKVFPGRPEKTLLRMGKLVSWLLMAGAVFVALRPEWTLWRLLELKFELLIQVAPPFILGFYLKSLDGRTALLGVLAGSCVALAGSLTGYPKWAGIHAGVWGCGLNTLICLAGSTRKRAMGIAWSRGLQ